MAAVIPSSNVEAAYEDMFKEITRKLYGEETGNGLHTLGTPVAQVATTGPTAPEGERSFTNLQQIDRPSAIEYDQQAVATAAAAAAQTSAAVAAAAAVAGQAANVVIQQQPEGAAVVVATTGGNFKSEDHLSTAFGLAALMQQNGFATATTAGTIQQQQQQQQQQNVGGTDQQQQAQIVQWTTGGKLQSYTTAQQQQQQQQQQSQQQLTPKSKSKNRNDHGASGSSGAEVIYSSPSIVANQAQHSTSVSTANAGGTSGGGGGGGGGGGSRKKSHSNSNSSHQQNSNNSNSNNGGVQMPKRYACTHCPYSTDRRDLYTRHENIHKDEKPFQCYACLKQFNRADHVKKHFLRMHRELQYDINKTRRHVSSSSGSSHHHAGGRGNITISTINTSSSSTNNGSDGSPEQKPNIFHASNVTIDHAFLESQRQPTSSSLSIAETIEAVATAADMPLQHLKQEKTDDMNGGGGVGGGNGVIGGGASGNGNGAAKPKREKRFTCCYCPWSGADKWGLKRHLNTHTKPFVCLLCDYKAARSERLATHVLKVHNKRACSKCSFLADSLDEFQTHLNEVHPHDNRPSRSGNSTNSNTNSNLNVLRTIGNTLVSNNQLNTFQNVNASFGNNNGNNTVAIYATTSGNDAVGGGSGGVGHLAGGGPLQEIIVNPSSMVGWRLSANGSLIPPHDLLTAGGLPSAAVQKRGSERLFQYLEADGSDPEDYARLIKMDAISRNTASVAQDFHKAGGVQELKIPANHQLLFNNKLPSQWTTREAAALLHSLALQQHHQLQQRSNKSNNNNSNSSNSMLYHQTNGGKRLRQHSTGDDDENTPSSASSSTSNDDIVSPMKRRYHQLLNGNRRNVSNRASGDDYDDIDGDDGDGDDMMETGDDVAITDEQKKAMSAFLSKNFDLREISTATTTAAVATATIAANEMASSNLKRKYQTTSAFTDNDEDQENQVQLIKSPPAYTKFNNVNHSSNNSNNNYTTKNKSPSMNYKNANNHNNNNNSINRDHRLDLQQRHCNNDKENTLNGATFLTELEYQNLNKIGARFQNYVKDIINKYYAETPLMFPAMPTPTTTPQQSQQQQQQKHQQQQQQQQSPTKCKRLLSETEEYIEYLKNKEDITLTITPKVSNNVSINRSNSNNNNNNINNRNCISASTVTIGEARQMQASQQSLLKPRQHHQQQDVITLKRQSPKKAQQSSLVVAPAPVTPSPPPQFHPAVDLTGGGKPARKSLNQIATLLPLLADAASKQQYLAAPLDFSKKPKLEPIEEPTPDAPSAAPITNTSTCTARMPTAAIAAITVPVPDRPEAIAVAATHHVPITPCAGATLRMASPAAENRSAAALLHDKRSSRKQAQPKKIRMPPEMLVAMLRDKYLNRMVNQKLGCRICSNSQRRQTMLMFNYHHKGSLALHQLWKHKEQSQKCEECNETFKSGYSLKVHQRIRKQCVRNAETMVRMDATNDDNKINE